MLSPKIYITELANNLIQISMLEFFKMIHLQFYSDKDILFMEYFLELTEHEDMFVVHHNKLSEYGVMNSIRPCDVIKKLIALHLNEGLDYIYKEVSEQGNYGVRVRKDYYLTPEAFKKCLMRAPRRSNQLIDPTIYCDYYILLEKIYKLYIEYLHLYSKKVISMKNEYETLMKISL